MKKPKLEKMSTIKNRMKKLVDQIVRCRDNGKCQKNVRPCCPRATVLHSSHIYPVGVYPWMRFEPYNIKLLCYYCHFRWWHVDIITAAEWIHCYLAKDRWDYLSEMSRRLPMEITREDLYEQEAQLLMEIELLKAGELL